MATDADVIIAGAGPAGSLAAYTLARSGVSVLVLEKSSFPRYKVCGAGLTHKILEEIPFDVSPVFETAVRTIRFSAGLSEVFSRSTPDPMIYCTMRDRLDTFLLERATDAGARVVFGEKVIEVIQSEAMAEVKTRNGIYRSRLVIGADGASSAVARSAGLRRDIMPGLAWEAEITASPEVVNRFSHTVFLDWGTFPGGYGWVFPKADHFSVGVGGPASLSKWMMPYYHRFMEYFSREITGEPRPEIFTTLSLKSWPIPVRTRKGPFHHGLILVTGDAAGLTDPLTGEGIYYAVRSGNLAARACLDYLGGKSSSLEPYSAAANDELMSELTEANSIRYIFNAVPLKIHRFVRDSDRAWRAFGKILRGERRYADVRLGFGKWSALWNLAGFVSGFIYRFHENRFLKKGL
jgi:geranylgeranyl reductase family protein